MTIGNLQSSVEYFIGWDVGAWNCDTGDSRDALCILTENDRGPQLVGRPWRGNLRDILVAHRGRACLDDVASLCGVSLPPKFRSTIAIDTPLGWPKPMLDLLFKGTTVVVPQEADSNPYLFRATELQLFPAGHRPLSAVRDMIGSQSTKGLHFLRQLGMQQRDPHVWDAEFDGATVSAIETYPSPCKNSPSLHADFHTLRVGEPIRTACRNWPNVTADIEDALICSLVARLHGKHDDSLEFPPPTIACEEGWIWLPKGCRSVTEEK